MNAENKRRQLELSVEDLDDAVATLSRFREAWMSMPPLTTVEEFTKAMQERYGMEPWQTCVVISWLENMTGRMLWR